MKTYLLFKKNNWNNNILYFKDISSKGFCCDIPQFTTTKQQAFKFKVKYKKELFEFTKEIDCKIMKV